MNENQIVVYQPNETVRLDVRLENEKVWLTQSQMATLFGSSADNIGLHLKKVYSVGELSREATTEDLRSKFLTTKLSSKSRVAPKAFTEKCLYMLATILKSKRATAATFAIIETFAKVRGLKRELVELHKEGDKRKQADKMRSRSWTMQKSYASKSRHLMG